MKKKAFYTFEATWMFGLALVIFIGVILLTIKLYGETYDSIAQRVPPEIKAVSEFRKASMAKDLLGESTDNGNKKEDDKDGG